jgi:DNA-binding NarL/FixJ family response regulator
MEPPEDDGGERHIRVVIVDDDEALRTLLGLQLSDYPSVEVVGSASNGEEARHLCEAHHPDAVVLDILMDDTRGTELIRELRDHHPDMRLIAYSGSASPSVRTELSAMGVVLVLKGDREALVRELLGRIG